MKNSHNDISNSDCNVGTMVLVTVMVMVVVIVAATARVIV